MRNLDAVVIAEKNKSENRPIYLFKIYDYDGAGTNLFLAQYDINVWYPTAVQEYTAFPIRFDGIGENSTGEVDTIKLTICNISRLIQSYLEAYDWRGKQVDIILVWANQLADADAKMVDTFYIDSYSADELNVSVVLSSKFDILDVTLPAGKYLRNNCRWKFKGTECGYPVGGSAKSCNRTLARCQELSNSVRYGGFPSIPMNRIFIGG
jgi:lambda family phage minor tail protein L